MLLNYAIFFVLFSVENLFYYLQNGYSQACKTSQICQNCMGSNPPDVVGFLRVLRFPTTSSSHVYHVFIVYMFVSSLYDLSC